MLNLARQLEPEKSFLVDHLATYSKFIGCVASYHKNFPIRPPVQRQVISVIY